MCYYSVLFIIEAVMDFFSLPVVSVGSEEKA